MKLAVIGANGNLGTRVTKQALDRGYEVLAIVYEGETPDERATLMKKSLFDVTREDIAEADVLISAYGSGFQADPALNHKAFLHYIALTEGTGKQVIAIGGAGSLYTDETHQTYCYETPEHPAFLKEISRNIKLGIDEFKQSEQVEWTVVCPSSFFDAEGPHTGNYEIGIEGHLLFNEEGKSYVTYDDLAQAMLDVIGSYKRQQITILTKSNTP